MGVVFRPENETEGKKRPNEDTTSNQKLQMCCSCCDWASASSTGGLVSCKLFRKMTPWNLWLLPPWPSNIFSINVQEKRMLYFEGGMLGILKLV